MMVRAAAQGAGQRAALIAAILTERNLGGSTVDLHTRLRGFERDRTSRARDAKALAERWARQARGPGADLGEVSDGELLLAAYPERVAKRRGGEGEFRLATGRGVFLDPADALARSPWLVVADLGGGGATRDRVRLAAAIDETDLLAAVADRLETADVVETDAGGRLRARRVRRLGALTIDQQDLPVDAAMFGQALMDQVRRDGLGVLPWPEAVTELRARVAFLRALDQARWPDLSDEALLERAENWLLPALEGRRTLSGAHPGALHDAVRALIPWDLHMALDRLAPARFTAPTGSTFVIDYTAAGGPRVEVRVQELFGLAAHPTLVEGHVPLTLALTSPARRPIQVTKDLLGFWRGSWADVRKDMRGRYPRHPWPENPLEAAATTRAKPRGT